MAPDVLTIAEVAERLRVSTTHISDRIAAGAIPTLPASVVGTRRKLIPAAWVERLIAATAAAPLPAEELSEEGRALRVVQTLRASTDVPGPSRRPEGEGAAASSSRSAAPGQTHTNNTPGDASPEKRASRGGA